VWRDRNRRAERKRESLNEGLGKRGRLCGRGRKTKSVREIESVFVFVCKIEREKERERGSVCVCQTERKNKRPMRERRLRPDLSGIRVREGRESNRMCV
jgi:hypothetical protein